MNKKIITILSIIVIIGAILTAIMLFIPRENKEAREENTITEISKEEILDDCTDEYLEMEEQSLLQTNSEKEKISPNCSFTQKVEYKKCGHTISKYLQLPNDIVNLTEEELQEKYPDWQIEKFSSNEVVLIKQEDGECGEHYIIRIEDNKIVIYNILEDGKEEVFEKTDISAEYLSETDKINIENGIKINSKQELNQFIEDFE